MKNFYKDKQVLSPKIGGEEQSIVNAQEILDTTLQTNNLETFIAKKMLRSPKGNLTNTPSAEDQKKDDLLRKVSFSVNKPTYVGKIVQSEKLDPDHIRSVSPVRFVERIGPRYFAESSQRAELDVNDIIHVNDSQFSSLNEPKRDLVRRSPIKKIIQDREDLGASYEEFRKELDQVKLGNSNTVSRGGAFNGRSSSPNTQQYVPATFVSPRENLFMPETIDWSPRPQLECSFESIKTTLRSKEVSEVKNNARLLLEISKTFSLSFNIDLPEVMAAMLSLQGPYVNMEDVRKLLLRKAVIG